MGRHAMATNNHPIRMQERVWGRRGGGRVYQIKIAATCGLKPSDHNCSKNQRHTLGGMTRRRRAGGSPLHTFIAVFEMYADV